MSLSRAPIGEILIRHEHLRPRELERLLTEDRKHRLVSLLILRAEIEIDDATLALSEQSGYPAALERHLEQRDGALARTFPQVLMRNFGVVPLTRTAGGALVVVARDPSPALADALRGELGTPIELAIAPAIFLERLIQRLAGGVPSALPPELPAIDQPPPARHRKSMSVIMNVPAEPAPIIVEPSMPMVELPTELIQPGQPAVGIKLELDDDESPPEPPNRPNRPTRPIPGAELQPLLETPSLDDIIRHEETPAAVSTRPTRPSVAVPVVPEDRSSAPHRKTPNIIKRPPTPLPVAPQPVARKITEDPEPPRDPAEAQFRPTYPKLEPPPPSVFDAETARPHKPAIKAPPPPPARPPTQPPPLPTKAATPPAPRPRTTTDNWDDFEDSKIGMGVPPADVLDLMSSVGITPPVVVPPADPVEKLEEPPPPARPPTAPTRITQPIAVIPPRAGTAPIGGPQHPRAGSAPIGGPQHPRAGSAPVIPAIPKMPPPIPKPNIKREIETAMSRATADRLLMKHAATRWNALLLVNVVDDRAKGSRGHGSRLQAGVESIDLAVASSSLIQAAVDPAAARPDGKDPLFDLLGAPASPSSAPVVVEDRVVAVLAAGDGIDGGSADELVQLAGALAVAYQRFPK